VYEGGGAVSEGSSDKPKRHHPKKRIRNKEGKYPMLRIFFFFFFFFFFVVFIALVARE
jgi:hypothetical protein